MVYALVDGNNFFVSCERAFNPKLEGRPVVVLSNNDGCIIARSNEAKALGIKMAQPYFQARDLIARHGVAVYSANLELYRDIHHRMIALLRQEVPSLEVYSVDEAFLKLPDVKDMDFTSLGHRIQLTLRQGLGLPVSIGIAPTKSLAKVANYYVKLVPDYQGVLDLNILKDHTPFLRNLPIKEVWGIGRRHAQRLRLQGIETAYDFTKISPSWVRSHMTVMGLRLQKELCGHACYHLNDHPGLKKSRMVSRSFSQPLTDFIAIKEAVAFFIARGAEKLRQDNQRAKILGVFLTTKAYGNKNFYRAFETVPLLESTSNTAELLHHAVKILEKIYKPDYLFKKAGVFLSSLEDEREDPKGSGCQLDLWKGHQSQWSDKVIRAMDAINQRHGRDMIHFGVAGVSQGWRPVPGFSSPRYTTDIREVLTCS